VIAGAAVRTTTIHVWMTLVAESVKDKRDYLTQLDAAIGDADHGSNMTRGFAAVDEKLDSADAGTPPGKLLIAAGQTLVSTVGGASGPLYGTFFLRFSASAGAVADLDAEQFATALRAGLDGIVARGKAEAEEAAMFDALAPAIQALDLGVAGGLGAALQAAADAADKGRDATIEMLARKGRASYLGERSVGHQDPGATSAALLLQAAQA